MAIGFGQLGDSRNIRIPDHNTVEVWTINHYCAKADMRNAVAVTFTALLMFKRFRLIFYWC